MAKHADRKVLLEGPSRTIECAVTSSGEYPAFQFYEELDDSAKRQLAALFKRLADTGRIFNKEQFKKVQGKIYEFKRFQVRVGCFQLGNRWVLTHGFIKKSPKWPKSQIERAERIMGEHLARFQEKGSE